MSKPSDCLLTPVFLASAGCIGHLLRSAKGFRAFNRDGKEIGTFENISVGTSALLELSLEKVMTDEELQQGEVVF